MIAFWSCMSYFMCSFLTSEGTIRSVVQKAFLLVIKGFVHDEK